uniref:DNA-directed RNA polymerase n=1 Tax=viral metagenome TaxID=1070528 RepID=A0A6C0ATC8_9ZZZZ
MDNSTIWKIIDKYFEDNPQALVRHHIESYNDFFKNGIYQLFKDKNPVTIQRLYDKDIDDYRTKCIMYFGGKDGSKIYFGKPIIYDDNNTHYMYPNEARLRNMTYGMTIHYDVEIEFIDILEKGELPYLVEQEGEIEGGGNESDDETPFDENFKNFKTNTREDIKRKESESKRIHGGDSDEEKQEEIVGSQATVGGDPKTAEKKQRGRRKKIPAELTTAQTALLREVTEQSMIAPNTQKRTRIIEKVFLGKFPIMVQSDFCILHGLPKEVRHTMGECYNDVGGYFIIDGKEKTVISQEKFGDNMLYIKESTDETYLYSAEIRSVSENVAKPIRILSVKIVAPTSKYTFKNIVVNIPNVRKPVPLFIVFRALGIISDKQIITMCLLDLDKYENMIDLFEPSVHDAGGILTQQNALKYIATLTKGKTTSHTLEILADYFFPHIGELNFTQKAYYLGYVVFRLLNVYSGVEPPTDRDNFKFKRVELIGSLLTDLFREYYTIQQRLIHLTLEEQITYNKGLYEDNLYNLIDQNYKLAFAERSVEMGFKKAFKGNWGAQPHTKRVGIVQDLNRLSHNAMMSHLRKINLPLDASVKLVGPRALHSTQWGLFDPIDTPDGGNIGIHKHLSISAYVTQGTSREPMIKWLREKLNMKLVEECSPIILSRMTKVIVNGLWAGVLDDPIRSCDKIRLFRRNALIPIYTSVTFDTKQNTIYIYTDAGRVCRPLFYRDTETGRMSYESDIIRTFLAEDDFTWSKLISGFNDKKIEGFHPNQYKMYELSELYGGITENAEPATLAKFLEYKAIIDYVDTNETENALIALNPEDLDKNILKKPTHMEIHESFIFGMMCNLINFPENNPATRNSFSCGQSKQACSLYHTNHQVRMDKTAVVLVSGQNPLVKTRYLEHINHESNPYGENAIVAIMCYTGYNVEDAVLINEGALKRGLFRTTYYTTYEAHEEKDKSGDVTVEKVFTNVENEANVVGLKPGHDYSKLDKYGIIKEGTEVDDKTILIGLSASTSSNRDQKLDMSKTTKKGQLGIVDKTFITEGEEGKRIAKVRIREERIPNIGDKMASRAGQKGTVGLVIPEQDMPFTKDGIRPDIIVNPHALPTRMTIGHLVECIVGKAAACYGGYADSTAFNNKGSKVKVFGEILSNVGYHSSGNEILYNGMTGQQIEAEIFMGPNYYMRLKHMVKDKINYRSLGPRTALTKQPVGGRANDGGLRIGEMERDAVISHGLTDFLRESMMERGDKYQMAVCNTTGLLAIYNSSKNLFMSPMADGPLKFTASLDGKHMNIDNLSRFGRNFSIVDVPYSLKLLIHELQTINVQLRIITEDNIQQLENMSYSRNIETLLFDKDATPATITAMIKNELMKGLAKEDVYKTPQNILTPYQTPEYEPGSPAYVPSEGELGESNGSSPAYNPGTPTQFVPMTPDGTPPQFLSKTEEFVPTTPSMTPPPSKSPTLNDLSDQALLYRTDDLVHYRGDVLPQRLWKITNVGDRVLTIEATSDEGLEPGDRTKIVTSIDIYKPDDFAYTSPFAESLPGQIGQYNTLDQTNYPVNPQLQPMMGGDAFGQIPAPFTGQVPAINIKVVGGNDFSRGGQTDNTEDVIQTETSNGETEVGKGGGNTKSSDNGKIDFSTLKIVKQQ